MWYIDNTIIFLEERGISFLGQPIHTDDIDVISSMIYTSLCQASTDKIKSIEHTEIVECRKTHLT